MSMKWDRLFWGIAHDGPLDRDRPMLLGAAWHDHTAKGVHPDEPSRPLLFSTRRAARAWCRAQYGKYAGRGDCCEQWRFWPVRVRETVKPVDRTAP